MKCLKYNELKSPFRDFIQNEYVDVWLVGGKVLWQREKCQR